MIRSGRKPCAAAVVSLALILAACGGGDTPTTTSQGAARSHALAAPADINFGNNGGIKANGEDDAVYAQIWNPCNCRTRWG
jgi:hypothetical protein